MTRRMLLILIAALALGWPAAGRAASDLAAELGRLPPIRGDRAVQRTFGNLDRIPTLFVFARDGRLAMVFRNTRGAAKSHLTEAELRAAVEPLL